MMAADSTEATARCPPAACSSRQRGERKRPGWLPAEAEATSGLYGSMAAQGWRATWRRSRHCTERGVGVNLRQRSMSQTGEVRHVLDAEYFYFPSKGRTKEEERDRKIGKLTSDLGECDAKIKERDRKITKLAAETRRLTALLGDRDSRLRKLTAELGIFTVELGERHTKIGELTADVGDCNRKLQKHAAELEERDVKIRENEAEMRRLAELLDELAEELDEVTEELAERTARIGELTAELGERDAKIDELSAEVEKRDRKIDELTAELEEYKARARKCIEKHRRQEEKMANVTLDPETAHPRLILSKDQKSVRWEYLLREAPDGPERFNADPCVLGCEAFTSGRHYWVVDVAEGQYCAVGVSKESLQRKQPISFNPEEGIWAVQQWGFKNRALTSPPTLLNLPRVPRKIRISLDYEWGEVAFFDVENKIPIFTFPPASFAGERIRPWFWVELGSLSLVR
ncbi:LOW QUALITY PROTEIN: uncharacterized protein LOC142596211 [Pelecanus crispus]|uniref:LOW QUALITY PROTEIN: uncharacterized protein LOC142596211 n=1 Tax=Pelecanus crispus TaxID=36300 RepID=UPI003F5D00A6